ncbi:hypothetical protein [Aquimarina sp. I32.4]|uniref:hypothetical protein n=1 Tax=Aquimarina sp. I32.4 TaxID=2053903 RepID=UPI000CDECEE3|nr:hypothetical protein [Aquimarina sp. I32.4]
MVEKRNINIKEIKSILEFILSDQISREEGSKLAFELRELSDNNLLDYSPKKDEDLIWEAILFIEGLDLKDSPNTYLHNEYDIKSYFKKLKEPSFR